MWSTRKRIRNKPPPSRKGNCRTGPSKMASACGTCPATKARLSHSDAPRRQELMRKVAARLASVAVVDGIRHRQDRGAAVGRLTPGDLAMQGRIARAQLEIGSRHEQLVRITPPIQRGLEHGKIDRLRELMWPVEHAGLGVEDHVTRGFVSGERARQPAKAGTGPQRRETHAAESGPRIERPRIAGRAPPERQAHIHPFAGGRELAQPIPHVLLRHQPDQRQERLGAQIICVRLEFQHAGVVIPPAHVELGVRIALAAVLRAHPSAEQRPAIVRMSEGQLAR